MKYQRGAALIETAIAMPAMLLALYGVTWGIRAGTVSERAEAAVRYAGVISAQQNPQHDYSLNTLYNNLGDDDTVPTSPCAEPNALYLSGGALPNTHPQNGTPATQTVVPSFWAPDAGSITPACDHSVQRQAFTGNTGRSYLLLQSVPVISANVSNSTLFSSSGLSTFIQTKDKFYRSPDLSTLMHCATALNAAVSSSLAPLKYPTAGNVKALAPNDFNPHPFPVSPNCSTGIGAPIVPPPPVTGYDPPGTVPSTSPAPPSSPSPTPTPTKAPTPTPTPQPTLTPTAAPTAKPTAAATATPAPAPSSSGNGNGGNGNGSPTPTPTPTGAGPATPTPAPPCCSPPTSPPTAAPTVTPATPVPTKSPATPVPTAPPTPVPTVRPVPTPTAGPPGSIS